MIPDAGFDVTAIAAGFQAFMSNDIVTACTLLVAGFGVTSVVVRMFQRLTKVIS